MCNYPRAGSHHVERLVEPFQHISRLSLIGHQVSKMRSNYSQPNSKPLQHKDFRIVKSRCLFCGLLVLQKNAEHSDEEPEAGDVVVEHLGALLLLQQVGGEQPELHDHSRKSGRDFPLQEKETALW